MVTGKMPFPDALDPSVTLLISKGKRPQKPRHFDATGITLAVWKVAKACWHEKANSRPEMDEALRELEKIAKLGVCNHEACTCFPWELIEVESE